jgi:protein SCO1
MPPVFLDGRGSERVALACRWWVARACPALRRATSIAAPLRSRLQARFFSRAGLVLVCLGLGTTLRASAHQAEEALAELRQREAYLELVDRSAVQFSLEDAGGRRVALADFRGKVVVLNFVQARCRDLCPLHSRLIAAIQQQVNATLMRDQVQFITVATDTEPAADSRPILRGYARAHGLDAYNWTFLLGGDAAPLAGMGVAKAYGLEFTPVSDGQQMHGAVTHVIDPRGQLRARFHGLKVKPLSVTALINTLLYSAAEADHAPAARTGAVSEPAWLRDLGRFPVRVGLGVLMAALGVLGWFAWRRRRVRAGSFGAASPDEMPAGSQQARRLG